MKFLALKFSPVSCYFLSLMSERLSQAPLESQNLWAVAHAQLDSLCGYNRSFQLCRFTFLLVGFQQQVAASVFSRRCVAPVLAGLTSVR
jgi:hypothetical protein